MRLNNSKVSSKFSLSRAKLPHQNKSREVLLFSEPKDKKVEYSEEDKIYSRMLEINPLLAELVGEFNLVYTCTGEKPKRKLQTTEIAQKLNIIDEVTPKPQQKIKKATKESIEQFTARILQSFNSYTREEILDRIIKDTAVDTARAFKGFIKMRKEKTIFKTYLHTYYLSSSAPF